MGLHQLMPEGLLSHGSNRSILPLIITFRLEKLVLILH